MKCSCGRSEHGHQKETERRSMKLESEKEGGRVLDRVGAGEVVGGSGRHYGK